MSFMLILQEHSENVVGDEPMQGQSGSEYQTLPKTFSYQTFTCSTLNGKKCWTTELLVQCSDPLIKMTEKVSEHCGLWWYLVVNGPFDLCGKFHTPCEWGCSVMR